CARRRLVSHWWPSLMFCFTLAWRPLDPRPGRPSWRWPLVQVWGSLLSAFSPGDARSSPHSPGSRVTSFPEREWDDRRGILSAAGSDSGARRSVRATRFPPALQPAIGGGICPALAGARSQARRATGRRVRPADFVKERTRDLRPT